MRTGCNNCGHDEEDHCSLTGGCSAYNCDCEFYEENEYDPDDEIEEGMGRDE